MDNGNKKPIFAPTEFWRIFIVVVILASGMITRLFDFTDPPLHYSATRQLRSAMIARGMYYETLDDAPEWKQDIARKLRNKHPLIEPEIIESITAATYRLVGEEIVWIARIYSSLFWVLAGLALYSLTRGMVSDDAGVIALIYYLFAPFGLVVSRTFQPDPLMTAMIVTAWMAFFHWYRSSSWKWAIISGITAGAAMYIKSTSVFFLLFGMAFVVLSRKKIISTLKDIQVWVIILLSGIPVLAYHIYGIFISGVLESQLKGRFFPQMWSDPKFYLQWKNAISNVTGHFIILLIGLVGLFFLKKNRDRLFLVGIWVGYILYGLGFSYHITTHYYYTLPAIPLLAVTLGSASDRIITWFRQKNLAPLIWSGVVILIITGMGGGYWLLTKDDYRHEPPYYQKVANFVSPEDKVVALSQDYSYRLGYFGWRSVIPWRGSEDLQYIELKDATIDPFAERFSRFSSDFDYFIITNLDEFKRQEDLFNELNDHYLVFVEGGGYIIFDLHERLD